MNIDYITSQPIPSHDANGIQTVQMCHALCQLGHSVRLICRTPERQLEEADINKFYGVASSFSIRHLTSSVRIPGLASRLGLKSALTARLASPDIVYTRSFHSAFYSTLLGMPTVFELHGMHGLEKRKYSAVLRRLFNSRRLIRVVAISDALRRDIESISPASAGKILVARDAAAPNTAQQRDGVGNNRQSSHLTVGYVGSLHEGKGLRLLLDIAGQTPWATFHIAGGPPGFDEDTIFRELRLKNVHYHGFLAPSETDSFRLSCDVLIAPYQRVVLPSGGTTSIDRWMSPLKLFEYMAAGRPIICSDLPVLREVIRDGENGLLRSPDDVASWCEALDYIRTHREEARKIGDRARNEFLSEHTYEIRARRIVSSLEDDT